MTREQWDELFAKVNDMPVKELEKIILDSARKADVLKTNADRIRAMSDEELAFWMTTNVTCCSCPVDLDACHRLEISGELSCEEILLNWLKAPVEEVQDG